MLKTLPATKKTDNDAAGVQNNCANKRIIRRHHSLSPNNNGKLRTHLVGKPVGERRCHSLSPSLKPSRQSLHPEIPRICSSAPVPAKLTEYDKSCLSEVKDFQLTIDENKEKEPLPQCVMAKMLRVLATRKREFLKLRKSLVSQQNSMLEQYAALRELETKTGVRNDESIGDVRVVSLSGWPANDILLLLRDDISTPFNSEISGAFGPQVMQQLHSQLNPIPEDVLSMGAEIMARRIDLLSLVRVKTRIERSCNHLTSNLEWKTKNTELDVETEQLHRMVAGTVENLKAKINYCLELTKIPWLDRETLIKKMERLQRDMVILQHRLEETKKEQDTKDPKLTNDVIANNQVISEELAKERSAREALKEVVSAAESMLRVARTRIANLERQLKDTKSELDAARKKHKDLEQLVNRLALEHSQETYRHRESSYDARSKKLLEVSKTGEITIETLSRQREALELRVKELREQAETAEKMADAREQDAKHRTESLQAKVAEQEKTMRVYDDRIIELENKVKDLKEQLQSLRSRSVQLVDMERKCCLEYVPSKENEPSDRETDLWKELQATRVSLSRTEEELRQSRADKDSFLNSLSRIAEQGEDVESSKDKMAMELVNREKIIAKLQHAIDEQKVNEKLMEQSMTQYENQLASLRLEVKRLRMYDCYSKEVPYQELETELIDLHMQVKTLTRERSALVTAAASRALMLERHERAAELFARMTRARQDLAALLDGHTEPPPIEDAMHAEVTRSLTSICANAAETWSALRAERARVLRLEGAVLSQTVQLEREERVRTQLERRRAMLERELLRAQFYAQEATSMEKNTNSRLF